MSKLTKAYVNGSGNGNKMAACHTCGKMTHTEIAQVYSLIFAGTDWVYCKPCLVEAEAEEIAECDWLQ